MSLKFYLTSILLFLFLFDISIAQTKKAMTFEDMLKFKYISKKLISDNGDWVAYTVVQERGDSETIIRATGDTTKYVIKRGVSPQISQNSAWCALALKPKAIEWENADKSKPKDGLTLIELTSGKSVEISNAGSYEFSNDSQWLFYRAIEDSEKGKDDEKSKKKQKGFKLNLRHLASGTEIIVNDVTEYTVDSNSTYIFYSISDKSGKRDGLYYRELKTLFCPEFPIYSEQNFGFSNISWHSNKGMLAFFSSSLTKEGEAYRSSLWLWDASQKQLNSILPAERVEKNWYLPFSNNIKWNDSGSILYFGMKPESERFSPDERKIVFNDTTFYNVDTILAKTESQIWHWNDDRIIPHQEKVWNTAKNKTYTAIYRMDSSKVIRLGDTNLPDVDVNDNDYWTLGYTDRPYLKEITWDGWYYDMYLINLQDGSNKLINKRIQQKGHLSPNGGYFTFFKDKNWYLYETASGKIRDLTSPLDVFFFDEENDTPSEPGHYGFGGWIENDAGFYLYDMYDIWRFESKNESYFCMTLGMGRDENKSFRIIRTERDKKYHKLRDSILLYSSHKKLKYRGFHLFETWIAGSQKLVEYDSLYTFVAKAKNSNQILISIEKYDLFPDLYVTDISFSTFNKVSELNEQLKNFNWGKAELFEWKNSKDETLQGYLIKPDNYDPKKKYPVLIYFYEKFSDRYHEFITPRINHRPSYQVYSGAGYIVFLPDIKYRTGNPGLDATDCLVSGAMKLIEIGIADPDKIGIQGHSWGGYETAFIVTQTDMFKAAVAGAPVANMTSAYSGIRLGSGLARQFQYEKEQSRIGGNLWDSLSNYINNSPVFKAPAVTTPLLIMFGDIDEAVPWQQGIELYLAMRRLGKNCIFLQYIGEPHHPRKLHNQLDYAIKMKEFFDHYLLKKPAPKWITDGQPYTGK